MEKLKKLKRWKDTFKTGSQLEQKERIIAVRGVAVLLCLLSVLSVWPFLQYREATQSVASGETTVSQQVGFVPPSANYQGQGGPQVRSDLSDINKLANNVQAEGKQEVLARQAKLASTPSIWPVSGDVTSRFGWRNSPWGVGNDWHPGIDIANNVGTPIFATADGEVVRSEWSDGYGNLVQLDHGNGIFTLYGHNSQIIVHVGQVVKKGQVISYLGNTGNSTGPHVHYEVRVNGSAVNPESFLVLK